MSDRIRLSCDCQIEQGKGFVHLCPAHTDLVAAERERVCKIAAGILPTAAYEEFIKRVESGATSFW